MGTIMRKMKRIFAAIHTADMCTRLVIQDSVRRLTRHNKDMQDDRSILCSKHDVASSFQLEAVGATKTVSGNVFRFQRTRELSRPPSLSTIGRNL